MNFTLGIHPKLRKIFKPNPLPSTRSTFKHKIKTDVPYAGIFNELLTPPRLDVHIQAQEPAAYLGPRFYSDIVEDFVKTTFRTESILSVGYERTMDDPVGKHGLDILSDLFGLLNGRLDLFKRIYIDVPEADVEQFSSGNALGLIEETPWLASIIKLDNASHLREFRWSGNFNLLKDKFQIPFNRLTSLSLLRCRIDVDDASLLLAQCHNLRALKIGTLTRTDIESINACTMPTTWWRHFRLRFMFLESLTIISECLLLEFITRLALNDPTCGLNLKTLSLTLLTQNASRRISELDFPWSRLKNVNINFQLGVIPSENSLRNDLIHKSRLGKSTKLRINESKIRKESRLEPIRGNRYNAVVEDASDFQDSSPMSEIYDLDFSTDDDDQSSVLTLPD
ncbi:hypothetical protein BYT27DRAFT_7264173 [Phlegmacium glaucopus]|nr:hypothetical protein BYT27DRAFT_7264173 [Phlegmacium glaucopus]